MFLMFMLVLFMIPSSIPILSLIMILSLILIVSLVSIFDSGLGPGLDFACHSASQLTSNLTKGSGFDFDSAFAFQYDFHSRSVLS